jgi:hypothetical protein
VHDLAPRDGSRQPLCPGVVPASQQWLPNPDGTLRTPRGRCLVAVGDTQLRLRRVRYALRYVTQFGG